MACCRENAHDDWDQSEFQGEGYFPRCPECGRYHRDVTPAFQGLVNESCAAVVPTSRRLHREFRVDDPQASWRYDSDTGLFALSVPGRGRCLSQFQIVGTWIENSGSFKWSWAWQEEAQDGTRKAADYARRVGAYYWMRALTAPTLYVGETEAWHLAMVTAYLSELPAVTAVPTDGGKAFLILDRPVWVN
ncbi:MAG: DUF6882 domain-containing protein [Pseudomonadota bacterium]